MFIKFIFCLIFIGCYYVDIVSETKIQRVLEKSYYENGKLEYETSFVNNKIDGYSKYWYRNGNLKSYV